MYVNVNFIKYQELTIKNQTDENTLKRMHYKDPIHQNYLFFNLEIL
jgi:hypothetical protein